MATESLRYRERSRDIPKTVRPVATASLYHFLLRLSQPSPSHPRDIEQHTATMSTQAYYELYRGSRYYIRWLYND